MAQDCPLCFSKDVFNSWTCLKDSLVSLSTRTFTCPLCCSVQEGLDKFTLHLVSHEIEAKNKAKIENNPVPILSIKDGGENAVDSLDELLADFSEFVRQEDRVIGYDNQVKLRTKAPNSLRMSPKNKSPHAMPTTCKLFQNFHTPLPLPQAFGKTNQINLNIGNPPLSMNNNVQVIKIIIYQTGQA